DPPGTATLTFTPSIVIKRKSVTLTCSVDDPGKPAKIQYRWSRGQRVIAEVVSGSWTIEPVTLETQGNFTCSAVNEVGGGPSATVHIVVYAPPTFIDRLPHYYGALMTSAYVNISCRVECDPLCEIHWYKNGMVIDSTRYYTITTDILPPDSSTDDFRSVMSTLVWNLSALPGGRLDRHANNANYTCSSSDNLVGPGQTSTAYFRVEYPPENITVSALSVDMVEGETPTKVRVRCRAYSYPESSYRWIHRNQTIPSGEVLQFPSGILREQSGTYTCIASNRHGQVFRDVFVNVLCKPTINSVLFSKP
uniref:Ig-like domain-containing protein n=1 Tax=Strigamia maritima TaxID=126957 RepID=T1J3C8_STRMM